MRTPFGIFFTPNITPDEATGIGGWSDEDFIRAMRKAYGQASWRPTDVNLIECHGAAGILRPPERPRNRQKWT